MNEIYFNLFQEAINLHKAGKMEEAEEKYNRVLNRVPFDGNVGYVLAGLYIQKDWNGLALQLLFNLLKNTPDHAQAWNLVGAAFRNENEFQKAQMAWMKAIQCGGETADVCSNLATLYADSAQPHKALEWVEKALKADPGCVSAHWEKALALLTLKDWQQGWEHYEWRRKLSEWDSRPSVEAPPWDGSPVDHLYIHGEQGVGDEIMFASAIPFVSAKRVTLEVNPKVAGIVKQTWPHFRVVTVETPGKYDAKIPIGSLVGRFGFNTKPYLHPHPAKVAFYRRELEKLGSGPYIAITWVGGVKKTRSEYRTILLKEFQPFIKAFTCVSAQHQYEHQPAIQKDIEEERVRNNLAKINDASTGVDLHDQAALFAAVDAVVTVQQTAVHVAGSVGANTHALIGTHPHWRYGIEGDSLPFYSSVRLHRKKDVWPETVERALDAVKRDLQTAERRVA